MATSSANDIITRAMVKATIISPGESVPSAKLSQVLAELNDLLESWALEHLMVYASVLEEFTLAIGQNEYGFGTGGDFNSDRPVRILDETYVSSGGTDYPVVLKPLDVYRSLSLKGVSARPWIMSYNPEFPLFKIFVYPTPEVAYPISLKSWKQLVEFSDLTTVVNLPPGYRRAIVANLAVEIGPNFGKETPATLGALATLSKRAIMKSNVTPIKSMKAPQLASMASGRGSSYSARFINGGPF